MKQYALLFRGINVGGKNKLPMADLRAFLTDLGFAGVRTYIQSGNAIVSSRKGAAAIRSLVERELPKCFSLDSELIRVLVVTVDQLRSVIQHRPKGFGDAPDKYHSDVIFLIDIPVTEAIKVFDPRDGVDSVWQGDGVIYSQRLSAERTKSRLSKIAGTKAYRSMTIRNWNTTKKLLEMLDETPGIE